MEIKAARAALAQAALAVLSARAAVAYLDHGRICERPMRPEVQSCARQILHPKAFLGVKVGKSRSDYPVPSLYTEKLAKVLNEVIDEKEKRDSVNDVKNVAPSLPKFRASPNRPKRIS